MGCLFVWSSSFVTAHLFCSFDTISFDMEKSIVIRIILFLNAYYIHTHASKNFCESGVSTEPCSEFDMGDKRSKYRLFRWTPELLKSANVQPFDGATNPFVVKSEKPLILEIPNFLSPSECDHLITLAETEGLKRSETIKAPEENSNNVRLLDLDHDQKLSINEMILTIEDSFDLYLDEEDIKMMYELLHLDMNHDLFITPDELMPKHLSQVKNYLANRVSDDPSKLSRMSQQVWLYPQTSTDHVFRRVQEKVKEMTNLPEFLIKRSDFQVVKYRPGGHYNAHHDSSRINSKVPCCSSRLSEKCRICRFATVLFYLNDVEEGGGTAFPVADNTTYDVQYLRRNHLIDLNRNCDQANLVVQPERGKAVMWYNHFVDEEAGWMGALDEYTWHGSCPIIKGEKWIANFWIKTSDNKENDIPY